MKYLINTTFYFNLSLLIGPTSFSVNRKYLIDNNLFQVRSTCRGSQHNTKKLVSAT